MKRFILTKFNKIIDTSEYNEITQEKCLDGRIYFYKKDDKQPDYMFIDDMVKVTDIIKEADNLIDLIEVGDLAEVEIGNSILKHKFKGEITLKTVYKNEKAIFLSNIVAKEDTLLKIYKPNKNGGYDLAWECDRK